MRGTQTTLKPRLAAQAAVGHITRVSQVCGIQLWLVRLIGGCGPSSVITTSPSSTVLLCAVCRARRETQNQVI